MSGARRPLIAIPARFSASASALRFAAEVSSRKLISAVYDAGGEPLAVHPSAPGGSTDDAEIADRLAFADGVLLPGGGDVSPAHYGGGDHEALYDMDAEQDAFDLAVARWALESGTPLLAVCRGMQVVNVAEGGTLLQDMPSHHRHVVSRLTLQDGTAVREVLGHGHATISCYHHQAIAEIGDRLRATAISDDGVVEALELDDPAGTWFLGVQWHPEDTAAEDPAQQSVFQALVAAARR